jgi:sodium/proline symporter
MLVGAATVIVWRLGGWWGLYEMVPGFAAASVAIALFSLLDHVPNDQVRSMFARMLEESRGARKAGINNQQKDNA